MKNIISQLKLKRELLEKKYKELSEQIAQRRDYLALLHKVKNVLAQSIVVGNENIKTTIEQLVTESLSSIYQEGLSFKVEDVSSAGRPGYIFKIGKEDHFRSLLCFGGGIRNTVSTVLRFILSNYLPNKFPFILDEVGSNISKEYQSQFGLLLKTFSQKFDTQIILITHQERVAEFSDKIIHVSSDGTRSIIL
jgi:DNA repair exonuclease SbcCD ATPase subunit